MIKQSKAPLTTKRLDRIYTTTACAYLSSKTAQLRVPFPPPTVAQTAELLLTRGVPAVEADGPAVGVELQGVHGDAHGG